MADPLNLNRLVYFAAVVDAGSFTAAAKRLGITKAVVSQQVARLEREVGTTLLIRTTRRVHVTEAGRMFHARCTLVLKDAEDAFDELAQAAAGPTGTLRLTAPNDYGTAVVVPVAAAFSARYQACRVELTLSDQTVDLVSGGIDMAIRVGWLPDSGLQARRIGTFEQLAVCGADFVSNFAAKEPADLAHLPFVANNALRDPLLWHFSRQAHPDQAAHMQAAISIDATPAVLVAVLLGGGMSVLPDFLVRQELDGGRLVRMLPEWQLPSGGIYTVYPAARFRPPKVTAFADMLIEAERRRGEA